MKRILDACCGSRMCWFDKHNSEALFMDIRQETTTLCDGRTLEVNPDVVGDFRNMPFDNDSFYAVLFDPPHLKNLGKSSWLAKKYGRLFPTWEDDIKQGFSECMRVLKPNGVLIFKWNEQQIPTDRIIEIIGREPLFGHTSGKGQKMTWEEWAQWVENHPSSEIVHRCGEFEYNINDVCLNPHHLIIFKDKSKNGFEIRTCQVDSGKWNYGVDYWFRTQGGCHGAAFTNATYDTEKAAVYAALQEVELKCSRVIDEIGRYGEITDNEDEEKPLNNSYLPKLKAIKNKIEAYKQQYNPMVLNLFGW